MTKKGPRERTENIGFHSFLLYVSGRRESLLTFKFKVDMEVQKTNYQKNLLYQSPLLTG